MYFLWPLIAVSTIFVICNICLPLYNLLFGFFIKRYPHSHNIYTSMRVDIVKLVRVTHLGAVERLWFHFFGECGSTLLITLKLSLDFSHCLHNIRNIDVCLPSLRDEFGVASNLSAIDEYLNIIQLAWAVFRGQALCSSCHVIKYLSSSQLLVQLYSYSRLWNSLPVDLGDAIYWCIASFLVERYIYISPLHNNPQGAI